MNINVVCLCPRSRNTLSLTLTHNKQVNRVTKLNHFRNAKGNKYKAKKAFFFFFQVLVFTN